MHLGLDGMNIFNLFNIVMCTFNYLLNVSASVDFECLYIAHVHMHLGM